MIMIGADSHKRSHTVVALDEVGRKVSQKTVSTDSEGHLQLLRWARQFEEVEFALEDCRHLTRRLEGDLLAAGQRVIRVPTRLMADARRAGRERGKSDPIDAEAVALAALRHPDLPVASLDGPAREVKLLSDYRRDLVRQRTQLCNKIRWFLHELNPSFDVASRGFRRRCVIAGVEAELARYDGVVARLARQHLARCAELNQQIAVLDRELNTLIKDLAPTLLSVPGCGVLSAAVLVGETAGVDRFKSKDTFARFTGTAPIPVWSGSSEGKVRLNRGGNRLTNTALHMIAVTQSRGYGPGRAYLEKLQARGKTRTEAVRLLRRRISDTVFAALRTDSSHRSTSPADSTVPPNNVIRTAA
jgi:transposase